MTRIGQTAPAQALAAAMLLITAAVTHAKVVYVDAAASGGNDGTGWGNAFTSLQAALAAAAPDDEVWVAAGTYTPGSPGDTASSFHLTNGVSIYGGFAGGETARSQRDVAAHSTILSGDVGQDDVYGPSVWYQGWNINTPNSDHVVVSDGNDATAVLDGFTIKAGHGGAGGGMFLINSSATVRHCTFMRNLAGFTHGGGVYCADSGPAFSHCAFVENYVHLGSGGGIYITGASPAVISDCRFVANQVITASGGGEGQGAGIENHSNLPVTVTRCVFDSNVGRAFYACCPTEIARGGGISSFYSGLTLRDCVFTNNQAHAGGGIYVWGTTTIINCVFWNNTAHSIALSGAVDGGGFAGGIGGLSFVEKDTTLINCVIARNRAREAAGFDAGYSHRTVLRNCIVWGNIATGSEVDPRDMQFKGAHAIRYSCVQDLLTSPPGEDPIDPAKYPGCIVIDPQLRSLLAGDLRPGPASPCIDAGENATVPAGVVADLAVHLRFVNDPSTPDTGLGTPPLVDMGAYEYAPPAPADLTRDGYVDQDDIALLRACSTRSAVPYDPLHLAAECKLTPSLGGKIAADLDEDGDVDPTDFAVLQRCFSGPSALPAPNCAD